MLLVSLIDFWNFNCWYAQEIYAQQPMYSPEGTKNQTEHRPLEGFVFAVTPFNFTSIAANLTLSSSTYGKYSYLETGIQYGLSSLFFNEAL